jgi:hypothetical protein
MHDTGMSHTVEILKSVLNEKDFLCINASNYVRFNYDADVHKHVKTGTNYLVELPDTKTYINVVCIFKETAYCDMKIISKFIDGVQDHADDDFSFSYWYEDVDKINFTSFAYKETCFLYKSSS